MEKYSNLKEQLKNSMTINGVVQKRYYHSLEVAKKALELNERLSLGLDNEKVYLAGLLHDAAKINYYEVQFRNTKDSTGNWIQVPYYTIRDNTLLYGRR